MERSILNSVSEDINEIISGTFDGLLSEILEDAERRGKIEVKVNLEFTGNSEHGYAISGDMSFEKIEHVKVQLAKIKKTEVVAECALEKSTGRGRPRKEVSENKELKIAKSCLPEYTTEVEVDRCKTTHPYTEKEKSFAKNEIEV